MTISTLSELQRSLAAGETNRNCVQGVILSGTAPESQLGRMAQSLKENNNDLPLQALFTDANSRTAYFVFSSQDSARLFGSRLQNGGVSGVLHNLNLEDQVSATSPPAPQNK